MKANTAQIIGCLNFMQFSIIVIDMDSGAYKAHYFEVKQCIFYYIYDISLSLVQDKKENKKKTRKKTKQV